MEGDRRNYLYRLYGKFLEKYNPKIFVFENVPGLLSANKGSYFLNMQEYFKSIGYDLDFKIVFVYFILSFKTFICISFT